MMSLGEIFLIPTILQDDEMALEALPNNIIPTIQKCQVIFAENERTARRHLKKMCKAIVIDDFEWFAIGKAEETILQQFSEKIKQGKNIAIISEAGCPGIADPGQLLIKEGQKQGAKIHPLVGPSSILLALMASGMNGQHFQFHGYLPVDTHIRKNKIRELETEADKKQSTQIFIETPYRNIALTNDILTTCQPKTLLCIASNITASNENIRTMTIQQWKKENLDYLHKQPTIFLIDTGSGYTPKSKN